MSRGEVFDALYRANPDPWAFETSAYERDKYDATLAALSRPRYGAALEVGCSVGVLTARLAALCDSLVALDVSAVALAAARRRCTGLPIAFVEAEVPAGWPDGRFDLILLSEILYFLDAAEVAECAARALRTLAPGGEILLVNWTGPSDAALSGDAAADAFIAAAGRPSATAAREALYRIDRLTGGA